MAFKKSLSTVATTIVLIVGASPFAAVASPATMYYDFTTIGSITDVDTLQRYDDVITVHLYYNGSAFTVLNGGSVTWGGNSEKFIASGSAFSGNPTSSPTSFASAYLNTLGGGYVQLAPFGTKGNLNVSGTLQGIDYGGVNTKGTYTALPAPEIDGSLVPQVGFLLACLFLIFGRKSNYRLSNRTGVSSV